MLWGIGFSGELGPFRYELDDEDRDALAEAFESIREVIQKAAVVRDREAEANLEQAKRGMAAKGDTHFQRILASLSSSQSTH
jgi:hypothetical protein